MVKFAVSGALEGKDIRAIRKRLGMARAEFAEFVNVSVKTIERWETGKGEITGPIVTLVKILNDYPQLGEDYEIPPKKYPLRLWYMRKNKVCTIIDVDEPNRKVKINNYTKDLMDRAFGREEHPSFGEYEDFLESRCFPRSRDKMKIMLKELDLPFYEPFLIIEKTQGRMAEDDFWIRIER